MTPSVWLARIALLGLALGGHGAMACGHCVEDRIAAVYDHALVQRAKAASLRMAYFAWENKRPATAARRMAIAAKAQGAAGVAPGSVRVSLDPGALAVAFDARRNTALAVGAALAASLRGTGVVLVAIQAAPRAAP